MRKRLLSAFLAVMMICTMLPAALAVDTDTPSTQSETATQAATARIVMDTPAFWDAWNAARDGDTINLAGPSGWTLYLNEPLEITKDITLTSTSGKSVIKASSSFTGTSLVKMTTEGKTLTLVDTSRGQYGRVISELTGDNALGAMSNAVYVYEDGTFTLKGGTLTATEEAETANAAYGVYIYDDCSFVMEDGTILTKAASGNGFGVALPGENSKFTMKGGVIDSDGFGISGNGGGYSNGTVITIEDGKVIGEELAIYHPQSGTLNIEGGTLTGKGGIETKAGNTTVSVTGTPKITAIGTSRHDENNNGNSSSGYALSVVENKNYAGGASVSIGNGYFRGLIALLKDNEVEESKKGSIPSPAATSLTIHPNTA